MSTCILCGEEGAQPLSTECTHCACSNRWEGWDREFAAQVLAHYGVPADRLAYLAAASPEAAASEREALSQIG